MRELEFDKDKGFNRLGETVSVTRFDGTNYGD